MAKLEATTQKLYTTKDREVVLVAFGGIISAQTINYFRDSLKDAMQQRRPVLLDFSGVTYVNSTGLGKLVLFFDQVGELGLGGGLVNVGRETMRLIEMLGLQEVLSVYATVEAGLAAIDAGTPKTRAPEVVSATAAGRVRISSAPPPRLPEARLLIGMRRDDPLAKMLVRALTGDQGKVVVSNKRPEILRAIQEEGKFDLAILEEDLPEYQQVCLDLKTGPGSGLLSIIKVGSGRTGLNNLHVCADEVLKEPFDIQELFAVAQSEYDRTTLESLLFIRDVQLSFASSQSAVEEGVAMLEELVASCALEEIEESKFLQAVSEAVDNARKHGNREDPFKAIKVQYILDKEKVTVLVEDEGGGFDFKRRLEMVKNFTPLQQTRMISYDENRAGLGINIMLKCCDHIEYTEPGNVVRLTKYL